MYPRYILRSGASQRVKIEYIYGFIWCGIVSSNPTQGHKPDMVMYAPIIIGNVATINIKMAKMRPNLLKPPSTFVDAKRTKNPKVVKTVAGIKLKNKHMGFPSFVVKI